MGSHGIKVDNPYLNLVADYMTRGASFTGLDRKGLKVNINPFTKLSFETTLTLLKDVVLDGDWVNLATPRNRFVMADLAGVSIRRFDVLTQVPTY